MRPMRLDYGDSFRTPDEARMWVAQFPELFARVLDAYRDRVRRYHATLLQKQPSCFVLYEPVEVMAVVTLDWVWLFRRAARADRLWAIEAWEHPALVGFDIADAPTQLVRDHVHQHIMGESWEAKPLLDGRAANVVNGISEPVRKAQLLADHDAMDAESNERFNAFYEVLARTTGQWVDQPTLKQAQARLQEVKHISSPPARGRAFEQVFRDILVAHSCDIELGKIGDAEQVDLFVSKPPIYALAECRWWNKPIEPKHIHNLVGKLLKRPPFVSGLYVSMSGFTSGARQEARDTRERGVLLLDQTDVTSLADGSISFQNLWQNRVAEMIRRYPVHAERRSSRSRPSARDDN